MNKREFLKKGMMGALGFGALAWADSIEAVANLAPCCRKKSMGLQMYSLRDLFAKDLETTLQLVSDIGYNVLETANYADGKFYGLAPKLFKQKVEDLGMVITSGHVLRKYDLDKPQEVKDWWAVALDAQAELGCKYTIYPWMAPNVNLEELKLHCDYFNEISEMAKARNMKFGFHNHAAEFAEREGTTAMDYLLKNAADNMYIQLDVYWANVGGVNPADYIRQHAGKIDLLHIKDDSVIGESGKIDFADVCATAKEAGITDWYTEIEQYGDDSPEECARRSYKFLNESPLIVPFLG